MYIIFDLKNITDHLNLLNAFVIDIDVLEKYKQEGGGVSSQNFDINNILQVSSNFLVLGIFDSYVNLFKEVSKLLESLYH